jgi:hypothetical protein
MKPSSFTRYYTFVRVNPTDSDFHLLSRKAKYLKAYMAYKVVVVAGRTYLCGFFVLACQRAFVGELHPHFPNFLLKPMESKVDWELVDTLYDVVIGVHPFRDIKKRLFD